jgi:hypothetical protein
MKVAELTKFVTKLTPYGTVPMEMWVWGSNKNVKNWWTW